MKFAQWFAYGILSGLLLCLFANIFSKNPGPKVHTAPAIRQTDSSLVLRTIDSTLPKAPVPVHQIPKGSKETRRGQITIQPKPSRQWPDSLRIFEDSAKAWREHGFPWDTCSCAPVTVDWSMLQMADKTDRIVVSSPNGTILTGFDAPLIPQRPQDQNRPWALGLVLGTDRTLGAFADWDIGRIRLGAEIATGAHGIQNTGRIGWKF